jgi:NAD+ kinase
VAEQPDLARIALVVHPTREIAATVDTLERWAAEHGLEVVQIPAVGESVREVAAAGELTAGDLVVALGGDGTVLAALRAAAPLDAPVLGVACGSLGALTAMHAEGVEEALDRVLAGDWSPHRLPALAVKPADAEEHWSVNDFVVARRRAGQVVADVSVDHELYVRLAGDGVIVATALGSTAYSMAAGGPVLAPGAPVVVCTPVAMHGGNAPPLVVPATSTVQVTVHPSFAGFDVELDGHIYPMDATEFSVSLEEDKVTLVSFGNVGMRISGLRERRLITDSPRVLARDDRTASRPRPAW